MMIKGCEHGGIHVDVRWDRALWPGDTFIALRCLNHGIVLFTSESWESFEAKLRLLPTDLPEARQLLRHYMAFADDALVDRAGDIRMMDVNVFYLKNSHLKNEAIMIGQGDIAVIWNKSDWNGEFEYNLNSLLIR